MSQPSYPTPFAWILDEVVTAELMNDVSSAIQFLAQPPFFYGRQTTGTGQPITTGTVTNVELNNEQADPYNMHSDSSDTSQVVIATGCDGVYLINGQVPYAATSGGGTVQAAYNYNGTQATGERQGASTFGSHPNVAVADLISMTAGDIVQLVAYQNSGGTLDLYTGTDGSGSTLYPMLECRWAGLKPSLTPAVISAPPAQVTWVNGNEAASSSGTYAWNTLITEAVEFLAYPPMMRAVTSVAQPIASGSDVTLTGFAATIDNRTALNTSTSTWTCPCPGTYLVGVSAMTVSEGSNFSGLCGVTIAGTGTVAGTYYGGAQRGPQLGLQYLRTHRFAAGDTVVPFAWQDFGSAINTTVANSNVRFFTLWTGS